MVQDEGMDVEVAYEKAVETETKEEVHENDGSVPHSGQTNLSNTYG